MMAKMNLCMNRTAEVAVEGEQLDAEAVGNIRKEFVSWCNLKEYNTAWYLDSMTLRELLQACDKKCKTSQLPSRMDMSFMSMNGINIIADKPKTVKSNALIEVQSQKRTSDRPVKYFYDIQYDKQSYTILSPKDLISIFVNAEKPMEHEAVLDCGDDDGGRHFCDGIRAGDDVGATFTVKVYEDTDTCCQSFSNSLEDCDPKSKLCFEKMRESVVDEATVTVENTRFNIKYAKQRRRRLLDRYCGGRC